LLDDGIEGGDLSKANYEVRREDESISCYVFYFVFYFDQALRRML
jgi:hypothetical protein